MYQGEERQSQNTWSTFISDWLCWSLTKRQPLWVILCCLPEKRRRETEEMVEEMKERDRGEIENERKWKTEEIKTFPLFPYLLQG